MLLRFDGVSLAFGSRPLLDHVSLQVGEGERVVAERHRALGDAQVLDLGTMDVVLLRQDPPFDMGYITATHMLERIADETLVVNDPANVRNSPEKVMVLNYRRFMPPTLVTRSVDEVRALASSFNHMADSLRAGQVLAVFPEGTTSDGVSLLPFHANLLQAAIATATANPTRERRGPFGVT
mgnify:CR=1 FL=1